jgi:hypothetical protein
MNILPVPRRHKIAALVGNGLSIAYDPALRLDAINTRIMERICRDIGGSGATASRALVEVAKGIHSGDPETDFEALIGALEQYAVSLRTLEPLAGIAGPHDWAVAAALRTSSEFIDVLHNAGLSHVLEVIATASQADQFALTGIRGFTDALIDASGGSRVTIGNLNYDSLVMAALAPEHSEDLCDMSDPRKKGKYTLVPGGPDLVGYPLRQRADYPPRQIRLIHLHGSLTWLRRERDGLLVKFLIADLREQLYWEHLRAGTTDWIPEVVLTNQSFKSSAVLREPYTLAYQTLGEALAASDHWLVVGYSFRDASVNDLLRVRFEARAQAGIAPTILVVTQGQTPAEVDVMNAVGHMPWEPAPWLTVYRGGVETLTGSPEWSAWASSAPAVARAA